MMGKQVRLNKQFFLAAGVRAIKTCLQTAVAMLPTTAGIADIGWREIAGTAVLAGLTSLLTSIASGLPEVDGGGKMVEGG